MRGQAFSQRFHEQTVPCKSRNPREGPGYINWEPIDEDGSASRNPREGTGVTANAKVIDDVDAHVAIPVRGQAAKSIMIVACFDYLL